jgi:hypothetical protein
VNARTVSKQTAPGIVANVQLLSTQLAFYDVQDLIRIISKLKLIGESKFLDKKTGIAIIEAMANIIRGVTDIPTLKPYKRELLKILDVVTQLLIKRLDLGGSFKVATDSLET